MLNRLKTVSRDIRVSRGGRRANHPAEFAPLIFRRRRGATLTQHHQWRCPVFLRLEINRPSVMLATLVGQPMPYATSTGLPRVRRRDEIIERVVRRQIRLEARTLSSAAALHQRAQTGVGPAPLSPPMILRTLPPAARAGAAPPATIAADLPKLTPRPAPPRVDAIDINRLTEQVVAAIDRRISAWRERTGRH